jgi:hypothetical protein
MISRSQPSAAGGQAPPFALARTLQLVAENDRCPRQSPPEKGVQQEKT